MSQRDSVLMLRNAWIDSWVKCCDSFEFIASNAYARQQQRECAERLAVQQYPLPQIEVERVVRDPVRPCIELRYNRASKRIEFRNNECTNAWRPVVRYGAVGEEAAARFRVFADLIERPTEFKDAE